MSTFPSLHDIKYLFIFGASYTTTGYDVNGPHPNPENPLGNPDFPGDTYADGRNWVGYLVTDFQYDSSPLMAYNYAVSGDTVQGVKSQVKWKFLPKAGTKPGYCPWKSSNSLFITEIGINDCGMGFDARTQIEELFKIQDMLYVAGARNFLFTTVPPTDRSPAGLGSTALRSRIKLWNVTLVESAQKFSEKHSDARVRVFDSFAVYTKVLVTPTKYGFKDNTTMYMGSMAEMDECIWYDNLHPTTAMHKIVAAELAKFLTETEEAPRERPAE